MRDDARRLIGAVVISAALHLSLIFGTAVTSTHHALKQLSFVARLRVAADDSALPSQQRRVVPPRPESDAPASATAVRRDDRDMPAETGEIFDAADASMLVSAPRTDPVAEPTEPARADAFPSVAEGLSTATSNEARALPGVEVPVLDDATWYTAHDLDRYPQPLAAMRWRYPSDARDAMGEVTVLVAIDASGRIVERTVVDALPPGVFDAAALAAFDDLAFAPGIREGRAVRSRVLVKLRFSPAPGAAPDGAGGDSRGDPPAVGESVTAR